LQKNACVNFDEICFTTFNILEQDLLNAPFIKPLIGETLFIYFVMLVMKPLGLFFFNVIVMNLISLIMQVILSMNLKETTMAEKELFAVLFSCDKFRSYIIDSKVRVHGDRDSLKDFF
jgi:hypothetical protein